MLKRVICTAIVIAVNCGHVALAIDANAYSKRLFERVAGVPLLETDPKLARMVELVSANRLADAVKIATNDPYFYSLTLRNFASVMSNKDESTDTVLNDFQATIIGATRDDVDARTLLTGNYIYRGRAVLNLPAVSIENNDHYVQLEANGINLKDALVRMEPQYPTIPESAGLLTTRTWAKEFMSAGTNRLAVERSLQYFLCAPLSQVRDISLEDFHVRRDVDRAPGDKPSDYQNTCRGCHAPMDALGGAFARFDFVGNKTVYYSGSRVAPKFNQNPNTYPEGYVTFDDSWLNLATVNHNENLGWRGHTEGVGVNSYGAMLSNSRAFSRCMTTKAFKEVCRRAPSIDESSLIDGISKSFEENGYKLRKVFELVAIQPACIEQM